jgi:hypothetical protein
MFWLCSGHPKIISDDQLAQLMEHLTEDLGVSGSKPRLISCIFSISVTVKYFPLDCSFLFVSFLSFFLFFFFTKILNIFKYNQMRWFHNLQFNVTIYKCKIRHKKYDVPKHTFQKLEKFSFYYIIYTICTWKLRKLSSNIGMKSDTYYYFPFKLTIKENQRMLTVKNLTFRISLNVWYYNETFNLTTI